MAKSTDEKKTGPHAASVWGLYIFCFLPFIVVPFFFHLHENLSVLPPFKWLIDLGKSVIDWADFYFLSEALSDPSISNVSYFTVQFSRLTVILSLIIIAIAKLVFKSNRFEIVLPFKKMAIKNYSDIPQKIKRARIAAFILLPFFFLWLFQNGGGYIFPGGFHMQVIFIFGAHYIGLYCWTLILSGINSKFARSESNGLT